MAGVDGVSAVAYGTPESAAAILAASESASGVRGGLGGGGAGAASLAVGEQLQNMVLVGVGSGGAAPSDGPRHAEGAPRSCFYTCADCRASGAPVRAESRGALKPLVSYRTLAGAAAPNASFCPRAQCSHQSTAKATRCDTLKTSYRKESLGGSRKPCQSQFLQQPFDS